MDIMVCYMTDLVFNVILPVRKSLYITPVNKMINKIKCWTKENVDSKKKMINKIKMFIKKKEKMIWYQKW